MKLRVDPREHLKHTAVAVGIVALMWLAWWFAMPAGRKMVLRRKLSGATRLIATKLCSMSGLGPVPGEAPLGPSIAVAVDVPSPGASSQHILEFTVDQALTRRHLVVVLLIGLVIAAGVPTEWIRKLVVYVASYPLAILVEGHAVAFTVKRLVRAAEAGQIPAAGQMHAWGHPYWVDAVLLVAFAAVLWLAPKLLLGDEEE